MGDIAIGSREVQPLLRKYRQPMYDEEKVGNGAATRVISFFSRPRGQTDNAGVVKTLRDTNLQNANALGGKQEFYLVGFNVMLDWDILATDSMAAAPNALTNETYVVQQIMADSLFEFQFGRQTNLVEVPLERVPFGGGPSGVIHANIVEAATSIAQVLTNGVPSVREFYDVRLQKNRPRHIQPDQSFSCQITWPRTITIGSSSGGEWYRIMMYGIGVMLSSM